MASTVPRRSRLRFTELLSIDGYEFWDMLDCPTIPEQIDDIQYTAVQTDRLDLIAYKFYGDTIYWWIPASANDIDNPQTELTPGLVLRIPSPRYVRETLFGKAKV